MNKTLEIMGKALTRPVTLTFKSTAAAKRFRWKCYHQRSAFKSLDIKKYDGLTFAVGDNVLTIENRKSDVTEVDYA